MQNPEIQDRNMKCLQCGKELTKDEIGLYRKLFGRGAKEFKCINCVSKYLDVPKEVLEKKICEFKQYGCSLFE